jgi:hypothetical protein
LVESMLGAPEPLAGELSLTVLASHLHGDQRQRQQRDSGGEQEREPELGKSRRLTNVDVSTTVAVEGTSASPVSIGVKCLTRWRNREMK